ncbi:carboxymuconolactone decarboxylase family protein [Alicyclobacillus contaminans]|uniref:carboxymuconolactone decarboxylase family protein n=1 Tax=Alicyclobacillus contaminans TaxID=392016 RepID=UPI000410FD70|nr:carboxymuconolactone decarboxylase family protein [Alicyclobacillus contaminans]
MDPLQVFKEIYGKVPDWVQAMHDFVPEGLHHYTALRTNAMKDGALTRKEKELILVGVNAARRYETSMIYHTQGALDAGATALEIADTVLATVISRGLPAWLEGRKAVQFALEHTISGVTAGPDGSVEGGATTTAIDHLSLPTLTTVEECDSYYVQTFSAIPEWAALMRSFSPDIYVSYTNLRNAALAEQSIPPYLKELVLMAINASERYPLGVDIHVNGAMAKGATKAQLAECLLTAVLTAGIPAWFTGYEALTRLK